MVDGGGNSETPFTPGAIGDVRPFGIEFVAVLFAGVEFTVAVGALHLVVPPIFEGVFFRVAGFGDEGYGASESGQD